jgi:exodeoxyribonuclease VII small subunit
MAKQNIENNLKKLEEIANYFEEQEDIDLEISLEKIKEATKIIDESKKRLKDIDNEFKEITK